MKKSNKKGFTLVEMLVVIAIIAILVAIIIPTVTSATSKAAAATNAANLRSYMAEVTTAYLAKDKTTDTTPVEKVSVAATAESDGSYKVTVKGIEVPKFKDVGNVKFSKVTEITTTYTEAGGFKCMIAADNNGAAGSTAEYSIDSFAAAADSGELKKDSELNKAETPKNPG